MTNYTKRFPGVDVAKIIAIFLVLVCHVSYRGLDVSHDSLGLAYVHTLIHSVSFSCIDLFALATGFLCLNSKCRYSRLATLWVAAFSWGMIMLVLSTFCPGLNVPCSFFANAALPVLNRQYWFFTSYFMLFLAMPFLNRGIKGLEKREFHHLLAAIAIFLCGYSCLGRGDQFRMCYGYSFVWLCVVYIIGAYIKLYNPITIPPKTCFCLAGAIAFASSFREFLSALFSYEIPGSQFSTISYTSPFTLAVAIFIFMGCLNLTFSERTANLLKKISATTFGIYLIHSQPFVWDVWRYEFHKIKVTSIGNLLLLVSSFSFIAFVSFSLMEHLRLKVFERLGINRLINKIDNILPR